MPVEVLSDSFETYRLHGLDIFVKRPLAPVEEQEAGDQGAD
jgi:hypothetical protein